MRPPRYSAEERKKILQQVAEKNLQDREKSRIFNQTYRRSKIFIAAWIVRLLYIILFLIVWIFNDQSAGYGKEQVINKYVEKLSYVTKSGGHKIKDYHIETNIDEYNIDIRERGIPEINIGDTILIERNIFGYPLFITKSNWDLAYGIGINPIPYCFVLILSITTLFLNDGTLRFLNKILLCTITLDIGAIIIYFIT